MKMKNSGKCTCPNSAVHISLARLDGAKELDPSKCLKPKPSYVHLVVYSADYEGYDAPVAAFIDEQRADELAAQLNRGNASHSCRYEVVSTPFYDKEEA